MKKLRLHLEDLTIESFETGDGRRAEGTVHGNVGTSRCNTDDITCDGDRTCYPNATCGQDYTCGRSCGLCGTYYCGTDESCEGSCINSCAYSCDPC